MAADFGAGKVSIWGRGVDPASFRPGLRDEGFRSAHGYAPDDVIPLFFGRLVLEKGLGIFAETVAQVRACGHDVRPLIVGEGPARGWLAERMPNATFMGHLSDEALGRAVASADLLINPSVTEAFGNVNLEAMASGLAVVSADVASAAALIAQGRTGLLAPAGDVAAYVEAVIELVTDREKRLGIGAAAAEAAACHRWADVLEDVARAYCHVLHIPLAVPVGQAA